MSTTPLHKFQVRLQEVDHAGVMFFAHLFSHAHDAYAEMMQSLGFPLQQIIEAGEYHIPLVHAEADYLSPMHHGQMVEVRIHIGSLGKSSFALKYEFNTGDGLCAQASTRHVVMAPGTGRSMSIPDELRREFIDLKDSIAEAMTPTMESDPGIGRDHE